MRLTSSLLDPSDHTRREMANVPVNIRGVKKSLAQFRRLQNQRSIYLGSHFQIIGLLQNYLLV